MRRGAGIVLLAVAVLVVVLSTRDGRGGTYRAAAIFDTAGGISPGSAVKIAGVRVGTVRRVRLTPDFKARVEFDIARASAPLRADARCQILPESLISEKYVQCTPGTAPAELATAARSSVPLVPLPRTTVPVSLQDLLDVFAVPTSQRLQIVLDELGLATAGRGADLNAILRRANPALTQADRVLGIVDAQRATVAQAVTQTDRVVARVAHDARSVTRFVDRTADVAAVTARRRAPLADGVRRLPRLLHATRNALRTLDAFATQATPLASRLRTAGPGLTAVSRRLGPFVAAADPALTALGSAAAAGRTTIAPARPVARRLSRLGAAAARPNVLLEQLLASLRDRGATESLLTFFYHVAATSGAYDKLSHLVTAQVTGSPCVVIPTTEGCDGTYGHTGGAATKAAPAQKGRRARPQAPGAAPAPAAATPASPGPAPALPVPKLTLPKLPLPKITLPGITPGDAKGDSGLAAFLHHLLG
ncbi:MlaD family protein [Paraconexibacter antarcticus]|uniref:MlaD family protein n=1 Tax=Paraconexibacter antarcticus TaxID=2949664 RepID=A0ABY5DXC2_9ACTN|nr:MlaD family protein [Paraconexibacter antarcticus]UTI66678.1 MlaD family protein [Paraconexibacter antarcticus]